MSKLLKNIMFSAFCCTFIACQKNPLSDSSSSPQTQNILNANNLNQNSQPQNLPHLITVTALDGAPIEEAKILIGAKIDQPFANNYFVTDKSGQAIAPTNWTEPASVTVDYPGYMRVTYLNVSPQSLQFKLRPLINNPQLELSGVTKEFGPIKQDNKGDFGLVMQAVSRADLFAFNIEKLISPEMDTITFAGISAPIPSNLTFPRQRESYIVPIDLQKERYRLFFKEKGTKKLYALHGQFPFRETIDQFRKRDRSTNIINSFNFLSGSLREITIAGPMQLDIPVNEMTFDHKEQVNPPNLPKNTDMMTISLFEMDGLLFPTDMRKAINGKPFFLKSLANAQRVFISLLTQFNGNSNGNNQSEASSVEMVPQSPGHTPSFLNLINTPTASAIGWNATIPEMKKNIFPLTTFSIHSKVISDGNRKSIKRDWEVYAASWVPSMELPEWPEPSVDTTYYSDTEDMEFGPNVIESQRWEVAFIGTNLPQPIPPQSAYGHDVAQYLTHVSFNSVEF